MKYVDVTTQAELDTALKAGDYPTCLGEAEFLLYGNAQATLSGNAQARLSGNAQATLSGNAQATLSGNAQATLSGNAQATLSGNAQARLYDNAQATLSGNAQARLYDNAQATLSGNAQARLYDNAGCTARGASQVIAQDQSTVKAGRFVAVTVHGARVTVEGGLVLQVPAITTPEDWCDFYGVEVADGVARLFKAVDDGFRANFTQNDGTRFQYLPGSVPIAPDWDGGKRECGFGLHFSPQPFMALQFHSNATRFVACPVSLSDMSVHAAPEYPQKVKARGCCGPIFEVTIDGKPVGATETPLSAEAQSEPAEAPEVAS